MSTDTFKRKLTAVMSADVAGYSRLMGEDEAGTVRTLTSYRKIIGELVQQHRGRVIDSPGDNILAEFASVVDAVQCGVGIQNELKARNADLPENSRMLFRIGINLGDVIEEEGRIYGDGVNIAARLESCADPGGICVSKTAFDHIETKLPLGYEYLGEKEVKNISKPVGAYKVFMEPRIVGTGVKKKPSTSLWQRKGILGGAVAVLVLIMCAAAWNLYWRAPKIEPASKEKMAFPLPGKPSIAVMPFLNMTGDQSQDFFCDGLSESLITALSKTPQLFVISRDSTFSYKGKTVKTKQVSEDLGVQYVLEGSVQKTGDRVRVTAQLIDALKGHHLWADRYDRRFEDLFAIQDEITKHIITSLQVKLTGGESARVVSKGTESLDAYLKAIEASYYLYQSTRENLDRARQLAEESIAIDPGFAFAYRVLGGVQMMGALSGLSKDPAESLKLSNKLFQKSFEVDGSTAAASALAARGFVLAMLRSYDEAINEVERAYKLSPNDQQVIYWYGNVLSVVDRAEEAIPFLKEALRLNPRPPNGYYRSLGMAHREAGLYEEAITYYKMATDREPNDVTAQLCLAATLSMAGREDESYLAAKEVLRINPKFSVERYMRTQPLKDSAARERFAQALIKSGLPERPPLPLHDKPSIAVLPFVNMSDDPEQEYFSDGISDEIINALVKWPSVLVIPRASSFVYKGKAADVKQIGLDMGVRYVLDGSVRRDGDRVRITAQLIDVTTLRHLFSDRYEREMKEIFAIQDEITMGVLTALRVSLSGEGVPSSGKRTKSIEAYLKVMQAESAAQPLNRTAQAESRRLAEEAIALDPEYARAYAVLAAAIGNEVLLGVHENPQETLRKAVMEAEKAIQLDDSEESAHRVLGFLALQNRDFDKAIAGARRAIELAPNSVMAQTVLGYSLYSAGRTEEALPILRQAVALSPIPLPRVLSHLCIACRKARLYEEALAVCRQLIEREPNYIYPHLTLAATFAELDRMEEARAEVSEVLRINPKYNLKLIPRSFPWKDQTEIDRLTGSLRKAGLK